MLHANINDRVRLMHDIPEHLLQRGDVGVVRSVWFEPDAAYEVGFRTGKGAETRVLVTPLQVEKEAAPVLGEN